MELDGQMLFGDAAKELERMELDGQMLFGDAVQGIGSTQEKPKKNSRKPKKNKKTKKKHVPEVCGMSGPVKSL